jgi:hypothetical protein
MRRATSLGLGLVLFAGVLPGCGTFSIPQVAAQGTTILIRAGRFRPGFGRVLNQRLAEDPTADPAGLSIPPDASSPLEDFQRGEILFALHAAQSPSSSLVTYLPVRYLTRVHLDEASGAATGNVYWNIGTNAQAGQVVALVDIPYAVAPGTYYVFMERWKRSPGSSAFAKEPPIPINSPPVGWLAWAGVANGVASPETPMEIRVVASSYGSSLFNDSHLGGYDKWFGSYTGLHADSISCPCPKLRIDRVNPPT